MLTGDQLYDKAVELGIPMSSYGSDLYLKVTKESTSLIEDYEHRISVTSFTSNIDKTRWYDIPFGYKPFWDALAAKMKAAREAREKAAENNYNQKASP